MTIYLAGPMTGYPKWNFPAFDEAAKKLRAAGYTVINPAEMDREAGFDENATDITPSFRRAALERDCVAICRYADGLALLPEWKKAKGAKAEAMLADAAGKPALVVDYWLSLASDWLR